MKPWVGFDLDGTLAEYTEWQGPTHIGKPVQKMIDLAKKYEKSGLDIKIFTARVSSNNPNREKSLKAITKWSYEVFGKPLEITAEKDFGMIDLYDDRCHRVEANTGILLDIDEGIVINVAVPSGRIKFFTGNQEYTEEDVNAINRFVYASEKLKFAKKFIESLGWKLKELE